MIEVPFSLRHLKLTRGYPHPFLMTPDSIVTMDETKRLRCMREKLCMICGRRLANKKWFIGGWRTAVNRVAIDPAMHEECARYSLTVCPFLTNQDMKYRKKYGEGIVLMGVAADRNSTTCLLRTNGSKPILFGGQVLIFCNRWELVEHWREGKPVSAPAGYSTEELRSTVGVFDRGGLLQGQFKRVEV